MAAEITYSMSCRPERFVVFGCGEVATWKNSVTGTRFRGGDWRKLRLSGSQFGTAQFAHPICG